MDSPRYALLSGLHVLALCADVDGLYQDPEPPPRVVHELRGCEPRGDSELARAVTEAVVEGTAPLGTLDVRTPDGLSWSFTGVRVLGARGDVVTVESNGGPRRSYAGPSAVPCGNLVRVSPPEPEDRTHTEIIFTGCSPRGALRDALAAGVEEPGAEAFGADGFGAVRFQVMNRVGSVQHEAETGRITGWDTSATHRGLVDLTVAFPRTGLLPPQRRAVWDLFLPYGGPAEPGTWRRFTGPDRAAWLAEAARRAHGGPRPAPGATYHLDGRDILDEDAFHCALGEAVAGPGRSVIEEDLSGATLVWHHADVSRACLGVLPLARRRPATFQEIVDGLRDEGVRVVLD